jgi:hypothetical protein
MMAQDMVELFVDKVLTSVDDDSMRNSKAAENNLYEQLLNRIGINFDVRDCHNQLGHEVHYY